MYCTCDVTLSGTKHFSCKDLCAKDFADLFVQGGAHRQGLRGDEGGVRIQVRDRLRQRTNFIFLASVFAPSPNLIPILSFRAMFLINSEGMVVAREVLINFRLHFYISVAF